MSNNVIQVPKGYPYILFEVKINNQTKYAVAATESQATRLVSSEQAIALPVSVKALVDEFGHQRTHELLAIHGKTWVCKEGKVFYKRLAC